MAATMRSSGVRMQRAGARSAMAAFGPALRRSVAAPRSRGHSVCVRAEMVKDTDSGVEFPLVQRYWAGEPQRCLGATTRGKKIAFITVKVYSVACYVEAGKAAKEMGIRSRGGFFSNDDDYCQAIMDGAFDKVITLHLVRDVDGQQLTDALNDSLAPRMQLAGETAKLDEFKAFFESRKLATGTEIVFYWHNATSVLDIAVTAPGSDRSSYLSTQPGKSITSQSMCRSLFEVFLGSQSKVPQARPIWAAGAKALLSSEEVKREVRKQH